MTSRQEDYAEGYLFARQIFTLAKDVQENKTQIKYLQQQVENLTKAVQQLAFEVQRNHENEAHEREKTVLRLENALLRFERRLPPGRQSNEEKNEER